MSSWNRAVRTFAKPKVSLPFYYDLTTTSSITDTFLNLLGAFVYSQRQNERCVVYDPNNLIAQSLRYNPQLKLMSEIPENTGRLSLETCVNVVSNVKFTDVQKAAVTLFQYLPDFNRSILQVLEQASIKTAFDLGVHIIPDATKENIAFYVNTIKDYQKKTKKANLSIYVMADSYKQVTDFQLVCDPSWKLTSLSKFPVKDMSSQAFRELAEIQIFAVLPAAILNFDYPVDRFIYIMQRNVKGYDYFKEESGKTWSLV
jgi:hypothetical protein